MVATRLERARTGDEEDDELQAELGRPSLAERADMLALAIRLRLGGPDAAPRAFLWGEAIRRVALVGVLVHAALAVQQVWQSLVFLEVVPWLPVPPQARDAMIDPDRWQQLLTGAGLLWLVAFIALLAGRWTAAKLTAAGAVVAMLASSVLAVDGSWSQRWQALTVGGASGLVWLLTAVLIALCLAAFHRQAPAVHRGPWLVALAAAVVLLPALERLTHLGLDLPPSLAQADRYAVVFIVGAVIHLAQPWLRGHRPPAAWSLALTLLSVAVLARLGSMLDHVGAAGDAAPSTLATITWVQAVAVAGLGVVVTALAALAVQGTSDEPTGARLHDVPAR